MPRRRATSASRVALMGTYSAKLWRSCMVLSHGSTSWRRGSVSSLLAISKAGLPSGSKASTLASAMVNLPDSQTKSTTSTSPRDDSTVRFNVRLSAAACFIWKPGVSTKMNCVSSTVRTPVMR